MARPSIVMIPPYIPHLTQNMAPEAKAVLKAKYRDIKRRGAIASLVAAGGTGAVSLVKDMSSASLTGYGYRIAFAVLLGPAMQALSVPFYVMTQGMKIQCYFVALCQLGAMVTKGEMTAVNVGTILCDFALFGEPVPITMENPPMLLWNETYNRLGECIDKIDK